MRDGHYKVAFHTPLGEGSGVAYLHDGKLHGGDLIQYYVGTYQSEGDSFRAEVSSKPHTKQSGLGSVFGVDTAHITLTGSFEGDVGHFKGTAREAPGITFTASLHRLCD